MRITIIAKLVALLCSISSLFVTNTISGMLYVLVIMNCSAEDTGLV